MPQEEFNLEKYLTGGVTKIVSGAIKATMKNPKESTFMLKYSLGSKRSAKIRKDFEKSGEHIPPFLIASITSSCNLHCAGCYARANHTCHDGAEINQLSDSEWEDVFKQAKEMGVGFILLAGGEPMVRKDVLLKASSMPELLFPIFTNGTLINEDYIKLFDESRNLIPIFSVEGGKEKTDSRRGKGIYKKVHSSMDLMKENNLIFGASVTLTTENFKEVISENFVEELYSNGCKVIFYIEYVATDKSTKNLEPFDSERELAASKIADLRLKYEDMLFISFPGDEKSSGGCLAAGRGFFHINPVGGAEPCPFSPYSDINIRTHTLREAMKSKLFMALQSGDLLLDDHTGGCVLFEKCEQVKALLQQT